VYLGLAILASLPERAICEISNLRAFSGNHRFESLPLRQIFYAFISNHLQRNSELKSSAYGFAASGSIRQPPLPAVPLRAQPVCDLTYSPSVDGLDTI